MSTGAAATMTTIDAIPQQIAAATIPGLPEHLRHVPEDAAAWRAWRRQVMEHRAHLHAHFRSAAATDEHRAAERERCRRDVAYFIAMWGVVFEPRAIGDGWEGGFRPFVPYAFQVRMIRTIDTVMTLRGAKADLAISKARDMGATWLCCLWALHGYLFRNAFQVGLVSRKEDLVDNPGDMDSMFEKVISNLERLPDFLAPVGFVWRGPAAHRKRLQITHPSVFPDPRSRNIIKGESTTSDSGRGGRATVRFYDEAAFIDAFLNVWGTGASVTEHRIALSSESLEKGDDFYRLQKAEDHERPTVLALDYYLHPEHDADWLRDMRARFNGDDEKFEREVLRNPHAGFGGFVYPQARDIVPGDFPWEPGMSLTIGIDPGYDDETAIVWVAYDPRTARYRLVHAYENRMEAPAFYADVILGRAPATDELGTPRFAYRANGIYDTEATMAWAWDAYGRFRNARPAIYGDPAGSQRHVGHSFYDGMQRRWVQAEWPAHVGMGWSSDQRHDQGRRAALALLLQRLDVHDTPACRAVLRALQETRLRSVRGGLAEQRRPEHDQGSHLRTALEYVAVNMIETQAMARMDLRPQRVSRARKGQRIGVRA